MADLLKLNKINKIYGEKIKTQVLFDVDLASRPSLLTL
jgi:hypothetical protein